MYVKPWNLELANYRSSHFSVLVQAKLVCSRAHPLHAPEQTGPEITGKPDYIFSNSKMVANTRDAEALKMFARGNEDVWVRCLGAKSPNRQDAKALILVKSPNCDGAAPLFGAIRPALFLGHEMNQINIFFIFS